MNIGGETLNITAIKSNRMVKSLTTLPETYSNKIV